jgi:predicted phosphodiesterase
MPVPIDAQPSLPVPPSHPNLGPLHRRAFLTTLGLASAPTWMPSLHTNATTPTSNTFRRGTFALDGIRLRFFHPDIRQSFRILMLADTHLFTDDPRGTPYREFSGRMAKAYNQTRHFQTGEPTHPEAAFEATLALAQQQEVSLVALVGDIFSFPSEAAVEFATTRLQASGVPFLYTSGNHDWHYEGMPGSLEELRHTWIHRRLQPLYQGADPLFHARDVNGVRFVAIDNSHYEILPSQLDFLRAQVASGQPFVLCVHIPLYAPGRSVGFGCGHPDWNSQSDRNHMLERRPRWPESGHTPTTLAFHREAFAAPNLLGILAGHIHRPSLDIVQGIPQVVAEANATGGHLLAEFLPLPA